jgi:hypothetical protein
MKALFGEGLHPNADRIIATQIADGKRPEAAVRAAKLGRAFPRFDDTGTTGWREALMAGNADRARQLGVRVAELSQEDRALVRREVGRERFRREHGRDPLDVAELRQFIAAQARPARQPVAGYDLVFTPVKSVSVLWALGDQATRVAVEQAHAAAVARAMAYLERHAVFTRQGAAGVAQIDTRGLVIACFDHRDSRNGDPNLHTHAAVANKVQGSDGKWRSIDGRVLHAAAVSASETYTTAIEDELRTRLGVVFVDRTGRDGRRPVREIDRMPVQLIEAFSSRAADIEDRYRAKLGEYRDIFGHEAPRHVQHAAGAAGDPGNPGPQGRAQVAGRAAHPVAAAGRQGGGGGPGRPGRGTVHRPAGPAIDRGPGGPGPDRGPGGPAGRGRPLQVEDLAPARRGRTAAPRHRHQQPGAPAAADRPGHQPRRRHPVPAAGGTRRGTHPRGAAAP